MAAGPPVVPKPDELLALHGVCAEMFDILRDWFDVPPQVTLDLAEVDSAVRELSDPVLIAALAMRKLQALHLLSTPGVRTTTDVVVTIVQDLQRALVHAPALRLGLAAERTDWDAELEALGAGEGMAEAPSSTDAADKEVVRFRQLHAMVVAAAEAVLDSSDGEIRYLE